MIRILILGTLAFLIFKSSRKYGIGIKIFAFIALYFIIRRLLWIPLGVYLEFSLIVFVVYYVLSAIKKHLLK